MFPKRFPDRDDVAAVRASAEALEAGVTDEAQRFRVAGRVMARREMGKITFLDLVDRSGRIQLIAAKVDVDLGDIVGVSGHPAKSRRGEPSLQVAELELLAKNRAPLPDTFHGLTDVELRYRKRYLDLLMNEETRADFLLRSRIVAAIRRHLDAEGFVEVETPVLQPRYGGAFAQPFVTRWNYLEQDFYLRIATELYLKRLIVGGLERVYELGKDFRNEGISYKHSNEFTMLEWYEAYADYRDTMERMERLLESVALEVTGSTKTVFRGHELDLAAPWKRLRFTDALAEHGLWVRDEAGLRAALDERGVDTKADKDWAQLVDHAFSFYVEPELIAADDRARLPDRDLALRADDGRRRDAHRALRVLRRRDGARKRVLGDQRLRGAARAVPDAVEAGGGRAGGPRLRRGSLLRDAADGRARARDRPSGDAADRPGDDSRRDPLPGAPRLTPASH